MDFIIFVIFIFFHLTFFLYKKNSSRCLLKTKWLMKRTEHCNLTRKFLCRWKCKLWIKSVSNYIVIRNSLKSETIRVHFSIVRKLKSLKKILTFGRVFHFWSLLLDTPLGLRSNDHMTFDSNLFARVFPIKFWHLLTQFWRKNNLFLNFLINKLVLNRFKNFWANYPPYYIFLKEKIFVIYIKSIIRYTRKFI